MPSYAITGAARGLGVSLTQPPRKTRATPLTAVQYAFLTKLSADPNNTVIGIVRNVKSAEEKVAKELPDRKNIHLVHGDLTDYASLKVGRDAHARY